MGAPAWSSSSSLAAPYLYWSSQLAARVRFVAIAPRVLGLFLGSWVCGNNNNNNKPVGDVYVAKVFSSDKTKTPCVSFSSLISLALVWPCCCLLLFPFHFKHSHEFHFKRHEFRFIDVFIDYLFCIYALDNKCCNFICDLCFNFF